MVTLNDVTLICVDCVDLPRAELAMQYSLKKIKPKEVKLLTSIRGGHAAGINYVGIDCLRSRHEYSRFMVRRLKNYFKTAYVLVVQWDGFVLGQWNDIFYGYDYIGAPWPDGGKFGCVGNGGFSLRSKKFCEAAAVLIPPGKEHCEDIVCCRTYRERMEQNGVRYASEPIAKLFSKEGGMWKNEFGFHHFTLTNISAWTEHHEYLLKANINK